jgi:hypothetical protein
LEILFIEPVMDKNIRIGKKEVEVNDDLQERKEE